MTNEEKEIKVAEALKSQDLWKLKSVKDINHKPHAYTIGPKHVHHAAEHHSGGLGKATLEAVDCAVPGCNLPYDEHTSDNVCFLQLLRHGKSDEADVIMKKLVDDLGEAFCDGFAFVETDEKYRIT